MALTHVSPSSWKLWQQCRKAWAAKYIFNKPDKPTIYTVRGVGFHTGADALYSHPPEQRGAYLTAAMRDAAIELTTPEYEAVGGTEAELVEFMGDCFLGLTAIEMPGLVDVVSTEERYETVLNGVPVVLIIDRVAKGFDSKKRPVLRVADYKTGKVKPLDYRQQMVLYAAAVEQRYGERVPTAELLWVAYGRPTDTSTGKQAQSSVLDDLAKTWDEMRESVLDEHWPPSPSRLCEWCPVLGECQAGQREMRKWQRRAA